MAKYPAVITTMAGTNATAEANASKQALIFTKIVIGAGDPPASIARATSLTDKRLELAITKSTKSGDGQFTVRASLSNATLETGFYAREIGLMAKVGESGQEILFSYTNGGSYVDYIPDKTTPMDSYTFTITTVIGNAEKVEALIQDNGYATIRDLEDHNRAANAHQDAFNKKLDTKSNQYAKAITKHNQGLQVTKGDNSREVINFITDNYNDSDINKVLNLGTLKGLLGQGAIVASKLDGINGYVKFANGFIIQWGVSNADPGAGGATFNFPIAFKSTNYIAIANGDQSVNNLGGIATWSNATNYLTIDNLDSRYTGKYRVIAMGV
ncbi:MAG: phage tail protein [Citrobacter freundii]|uniref:Tail-collar fiber protein n=1 Tax=Caudovirales sp. ctem730 TaxID=2825770 RepID=A0A8S5PT84_9CAUD|nr:phage tail protein [Citrobacter freundii]DAE09741.1 MAG TPA: tail-collar fiber protein [Caudovirales sp. ctem730]